MGTTPLGYLSREDPLYAYLQSDILPQMGISSGDSAYRVSRFDNANDVYLYEEENRHVRLVGKFIRGNSPEQARRKGETEFGNLLFLREIGFSAAPHYVQKPYGFNPAIDNVLISEFVSGTLLSTIFTEALQGNRRDRLFRKLSALADFLAALHNRTAGEETVDFDSSYQYMERLLRFLMENSGLESVAAEAFRSLGGRWRSKSCMWEDRKVLVHGDATPANFVLGKGTSVMAIDLERMKWADRVFDLGRLCRRAEAFLLPGHGQPPRCRAFHRAFSLGVRRSFPGSGGDLYCHHQADSLLHGDHAPAHCPQRLGG